MSKSDRRMWKDDDESLERKLSLRRSGAAGKHDSRPNRKRTRKNAKDNAIRDSRNEDN